MNEKELMQAILNEVQGMKLGMQDMQQDMQGMKQDMRDMQQDMQDMKLDIQNLNQRVTGIELHLENVTDKNIQLLAENHIDLINKLNAAVPAANKNLLYEVKVDYLVERVDKLEKEMSDIKNKIA